MSNGQPCRCGHGVVLHGPVCDYDGCACTGFVLPSDDVPYTREELQDFLSDVPVPRGFERMVATARAGLADTERLQWTVTQLRSALENWGRHHGWCNGPGPLECNCGYRAALETGYEVGAGAVARDPESGNKRSVSRSE